MRGDAGTDAESENEASHSMPNVSPANAYIDSDDSDDDDDDSDGGSHDSRDWVESHVHEDEDEFEIDEELEKNTEASRAHRFLLACDILAYG